MTEKQLLKMKERIELEKQEKSRLQGKLDSLMDRLKKEYRCETIEEAKKKLVDLETERAQLEEQIDDKAKLIESRYEQLQR